MTTEPDGSITCLQKRKPPLLSRLRYDGDGVYPFIPDHGKQRTGKVELLQSLVADGWMVDQGWRKSRDSLRIAQESLVLSAIVAV